MANRQKYTYFTRRVTVTDVNDNAPVFDRLPNGCVSITEFHEIGDTVILLKVVDADDPSTPNGKINFHIADGNDLGNNH